MGFKLMAGAVASCALIGVAVGVGIIYGSLLISIGRKPPRRPMKDTCQWTTVVNLKMKNIPETIIVAA